jgi:hypothetical protein
MVKNYRNILGFWGIFTLFLGEFPLLGDLVPLEGVFALEVLGLRCF